MASISFTVNARSVEVTADGDTPLLDVLRNHLGLTGTRFGCGLEQCGSCMVLIDGLPEKSCGKALSTVAGKAFVTIEGMGTPDKPHPLQQAFLDEQAGQCGYCLSGILISAKALLDRNPAPTREDVVDAICGNICRCTGYEPIILAILDAARSDSRRRA
jgi:nicotinate dehydrogenase subunit A